MITDYATLQDEVANWLDRDDLTARIPTFIQLAEAKIRRRARKKVVRTTIVVSARETVLPADCAELRSACIRSSSPSLDRPLTVTTPESLAKFATRSTVAGRPKYGSIVEGQLLLVPTPDASYSIEVIYFEKLTPLSDSVVTNSVIADSPDAYLYGALLEAMPYLKDDERAPLWKGMFDEAIETMNDSRQREEYNASLRPAGLPVVFG